MFLGQSHCHRTLAASVPLCGSAKLDVVLRCIVISRLTCVGVCPVTPAGPTGLDTTGYTRPSLTRLYYVILPPNVIFPNTEKHCQGYNRPIVLFEIVLVFLFLCILCNCVGVCIMLYVRSKVKLYSNNIQQPTYSIVECWYRLNILYGSLLYYTLYSTVLYSIH